MEISVKKIGSAKGTVGWLAKGLGDGSLTLVEGRLKDGGNHGLWLKGDKVSQFLAAWNVYNLSALEMASAASYFPAGDEDREGLWTDAAWKSLMGIARKWCDACNDAVANERPLDISIIRIQKEATAI